MSRAELVDIAAKLRSLPIFEGVDPKTLGALSNGLVFRRILADEVLFHALDPAECCYLVSYGAVKLWRSSPQKKEMVMHFCRSGEFIGAAILMNQDPRYPVNATAMEDSGLIQIPRRIYIDVWQATPQIAQRVNVQIMGRLMEFQDDKVMTASPVPQKIARFLLRTVDSQAPIYGSRISLKLTRRDIAERVGTTVETVIRILSKWSQQGWIRIEDQHIDILNREAFEALLSEPN